MSISVATYRKGGTRDAMMPAARKSKALFERHGADHFILNHVVADPDSGQRAIVIMFTNWEALGRVMQNAANDPAFHEFLAGIEAVSETVSRAPAAVGRWPGHDGGSLGDFSPCVGTLAGRAGSRPPLRAQ